MRKVVYPSLVLTVLALFGCNIGPKQQNSSTVKSSTETSLIGVLDAAYDDLLTCDKVKISSNGKKISDALQSLNNQNQDSALNWAQNKLKANDAEMSGRAANQDEAQLRSTQFLNSVLVLDESGMLQELGYFGEHAAISAKDYYYLQRLIASGYVKGGRQDAVVRDHLELIHNRIGAMPPRTSLAYDAYVEIVQALELNE